MEIIVKINFDGAFYNLHINDKLMCGGMDRELDIEEYYKEQLEKIESLYTKSFLTEVDNRITLGRVEKKYNMEYMCEIWNYFATLKKDVEIEDFTVDKKLLLYKMIYDRADVEYPNSSLLNGIYSVMGDREKMKELMNKLKDVLSSNNKE